MSQQEFLPIFNELIKSGTLYIYENTDGQFLVTCIVCRFETTLCTYNLSNNICGKPELWYKIYSRINQ